MWQSIALILVASCVSSNANTCPGGIVCPADADCVMVGGYPACATKDDVAACNGHDAGFACDPASEHKACHDGVCIDTCGNRQIEPYETCDDGNQVAGDQCSARCLVEGCGNGEVDRLLGEECDDGVPGQSGDGCSSTCKLEKPVWSPLVQGDITARAGVAMATRPGAAGRVAEVVQFGGIGVGGTFAETWLWHGSDTSPTWTQAFPPRSPTGRQGHAMTYDSARDRIVLFGGYAATGVLGDTWEWDGAVWTDVSPPSTPGGRLDMGLAYDPARHVSVMYGGATPQGSLRDTWEWNGTTWTNFPLLFPPPENRYVQLAYDATAGELIYCGMPETPSTWKYDGTWTDLGVACPTSGTVAPKPNRMAYDARRGTIVLVQAGGNVYEWNAGTRQWVADGAVGTKICSVRASPTTARS
jgi:cysteine-rich repeat protein